MKITLAITGASGTIYARRLLSKLTYNDAVNCIYVIMSAMAKEVAKYELSELSEVDFIDEIERNSKTVLLSNSDFFTPIASGSNSADVMVILPASMGAIGRITAGVSGDLIARAADVMLKEEKKLIVCPRETPLSLLHLRNLTTLKEFGATILPAVPSFYSRPKTIDELVDTVVDRILIHIGVENKGFMWQNDI